MLPQRRVPVLSNPVASLDAQVLAVWKSIGGFQGVPSPATCFTDFAGTPCVEDSVVAMMYDATQNGALGTNLAPGGGTFDSSSGWTAAGAWIISGGVASVTGASGELLRSTGGLVSGKLYKTSFTITSFSSGNCRVYAGGILGTARSAVGTYTEYIICGSSNTNLAITATSGTYSVDNISFQEVLGYNFVQTGATALRPILRAPNSVRDPITSTTGEVWTPTRTFISGDARIRKDSSGTPYAAYSGTTSNYWSTPDAAALDLSGNASCVLIVAPNDNTPASIQGLISNLSGTTGEFSVYIGADGTVGVRWYLAGVAQSYISTSPIPYSDGTKYWIRVKLTRGTKVVFETSTDGTNYTQLGTDVTAVSLATASTNPMLVGCRLTTEPLNGKIYYAAIYANDTATGTPAAVFNPSLAVFGNGWSLDFDGTQTFLDIPSATAMMQNVAAGTLVSAYSHSGLANADTITFSYNAGGGARMAIRTLNTTQHSIVGRRLDGDTAVAISGGSFGRAVTHGKFNPVGRSIIERVNGVDSNPSTYNPDTSGNTSNTASYGVSVGCVRGSSNSNFWRGQIYYFAAAPALLTSAQQALVDNYAKKLSGVSF